ncbi:TadE/TadG family type IV pilus assembly protein [Cupriavidus oxalaticus]|uniref:TadE/TadG family type IV pilus assembly protein n=1 Tax=Cupriavidus oxalaticus TaxID=96344 RepID=UPI004033285F
MKAVIGFRTHRCQRGVAAVEFALVAGIFFTLLIGIVEFSRVLFYWNTAGEATRLGARLAAVCDYKAPGIYKQMRQLMPLLSDANIDISYEPSSPTQCDPDAATARKTCESVTVRVVDVNVATVIPIVPISLTMPPFTTTLPRESMNSATGGPVCS